MDPRSSSAAHSATPIFLFEARGGRDELAVLVQFACEDVDAVLEVPAFFSRAVPSCLKVRR
jgi:hypothetical protein